MKPSNLALRMDSPADGGAREGARSATAVSVDPRKLQPRSGRCGFDRRAFEQRTIELRGQGLPPFRVR